MVSFPVPWKGNEGVGTSRIVQPTCIPSRPRPPDIVPPKLRHMAVTLLTPDVIQQHDGIRPFQHVVENTILEPGLPDSGRSQANIVHVKLVGVAVDLHVHMECTIGAFEGVVAVVLGVVEDFVGEAGLADTGFAENNDADGDGHGYGYGLCRWGDPKRCWIRAQVPDVEIYRAWGPGGKYAIRKTELPRDVGRWSPGAEGAVCAIIVALRTTTYEYGIGASTPSFLSIVRVSHALFPPLSSTTFTEIALAPKQVFV